MNDFVWIRKEVVLAIHRRQLTEHGGSEGLRDSGLLDSALARPKNVLAYTEGEISLSRLAASYAAGIARNHPFVDGNKRTAFVVCRTFLELNGAHLDASPEDKYQTFLRLAAGSLSEEELAQWIGSHLGPG